MRWLRLITLLAIYTGFGCAAGAARNAWQPRSPPYDLGFANGTNLKLDGVDSMWHENDFDYHAGPGVLGPGARGEIGNAPGPIPRHLRLLWKTPDGKRHEATVAVAEKVPDAAHFSGTVWLKITKSGVKVVPLTDSQMLRMAEKSQPYP